MGDTSYWNDDRAAIVKECYELAIQFEPSDQVKTLLVERKEKISTPSDYIPMQSTNPSARESEMSVISQIMSDFSLDKVGTIQAPSEQPNVYRINNMSSNSAEAQYVQAMLAINRNSNESGRNSARSSIINAIKLAGYDPRYKTFAMILQEADT